ncbi:MAG TPA: hypothetical protein VF834_23735, partial [Streptosporangiaceae bacterium]
LLGYNLGNTVTKFFHSFSLVGAVLVVLLLGGLIAHRVHAIRKESHHGAATAAVPSDDPKVGTGRSGGAHRSR